MIRVDNTVKSANKLEIKMDIAWDFFSRTSLARFQLVMRKYALINGMYEIEKAVMSETKKESGGMTDSPVSNVISDISYKE